MPVGNKGGILLVANIKRYTFTSTGLSFATLSTIYSHSSEKGNIEVPLSQASASIYSYCEISSYEEANREKLHLT